MVYVVTSNTIAGRDNRAPAPALRADGTAFDWRMFFDNNQRIVDADTTEELLGFLIPNYSAMTKEEKQDSRVELARGVQQLARATILSELSDDKVESLQDWEINVLSYGNDEHSDPFGWGDGSGQFGVLNDEVPDEWNSDVPLVLLDINYAPYTEVPTPLSGFGDFIEVPNLIWLRPTGELEFLRSLSRIGFITFGTPRPTMNGEVQD